MPELKTYDLFVSHAWKREENSEYYRFVKLLNEASWFKWRNYSVPEHDPLDIKTRRELQEKLTNQIRPVNAFVLLAGMYYHYRDWIQFELGVANDFSKPIILVRPRGQERIPVELTDIAGPPIGWNTDSIVKAIRDKAL